MTYTPVIKFGIGYAFCLTLWSLTMVVSNNYYSSKYNGLLGFVVLFGVYFYLNFSLKALYTEIMPPKLLLIRYGVIIAIMGCAISTAVMWAGNDLFAVQPNKIANSIRAIVVHGLLGIVMSTLIANRIFSPGKF